MKAKGEDYPLVATGKDRRTCDSYQFDTKVVCIPLVSSTGHGHASLKYVHYQEGKFALGTILVAVIPKDENVLNAQFLHLYLSRLKDSILVPLMTGAANVTLTVTKLKTVKVPLPPIEEQLRIVSLFNRMDNEQAELINEISNQQTLLKKLRQSILQEAIEGKLTTSWQEQNTDVESTSVLLEKIKAEKEKLIKEKKIKKQKPLPLINEDEIPFDIPDSWEWCRLDDISLVGTGATPLTSNTDYYKDGDINWITSSATGSDYVFEAEKKITNKAVSETNCNINPIGTLVIAMYGQGKTRGQITELMIDAATNQACATINTYLEEKALTQFIKKYFNMIYLEIRKLAAGGSQPNLNMLKIRKTVIPLPPLEEQQEIVKKTENFFKICDELETQINSSKVNSEMLMQAVLKEAFEK
ncbi:MAG: restriction endonuclease subunit S [Candidatus Kariarchaeaceae archaeon]